jgi:murein DD-endopeptidase MepM/ murein hydrolase activator NlpD
MLAAAVIVGLGAALFAYAFPVTAGAFWPFSDAQAAAPEPVIHDSTLALLSAATNVDPNGGYGETDLQVTGGSALLPDDVASDGFVASGGTGVITTYTVREGDNLSQIADTFGISVNTILWANDIKDAKTIHAGDTLVILPVSGVRYTVKKGGTLSDVAKLFNADVDEIALFNGIDPSAPLAAGTEIIIPGGSELTSSPAKSTTKSSSGVKAGTSTSVVTSGYFRNPLPGGILTQGIHGTNAVDIGAPAGTPIYAAAAGTVIISKNNGAWNGGYGSYVVITHNNGTQTLYAHMSKDVASVGETVAAGDVIGYVGRTGEATGNHLHFEVRGGTNPFRGCALMKACTLK